MAIISPRREVSEFRRRYKWMALGVFVIFALYAGRAVQLQIFQYKKWNAIAEDNVTRTVHLPATRGVIRDTAGRILADNRPAYNVLVTPQMVDEERDVRRIAELMDLSEDEVERFKKKLAAVPDHRRTHEIEMFTDISRDQVAALETHTRELPGLDVVAVPVRTYPYGSIGGHAIGYINQVSAEDLQKLGNTYRAGDRVGRQGVEKAWESYLRGRDGYQRVYVDARGMRQERVDDDEEEKAMRREPSPGHDLSLTLDMELMRGIQNAFRGQPAGAAVVVDVKSGKVRALFSKPSYDPNAMSGRLSGDAYRELSENAFRPLLDKTVFETFFPGSTFKVVTALAALAEGTITPTDRIECPGYYESGKRRFKCGKPHGDVDMHHAIVQSCNVYFWRLAEKLEIDRINAYARELGFGEQTGVGINSEASGFLASRDWYEKHQPDNRFFIGFTLNTAIGQGNTRVTLLQLAMAYAAIANGGDLFLPMLVERVSDPSGAVVQEFEPQIRRHLKLPKEYLDLVSSGLYGVVNDANGTAFEARIEGGVHVAGKTGTAQVSYRAPKPGEERIKAEYFNRDHAWFAGFAPAEAPEIAIVVLVEHGGAGGKNAAPIATQIAQQYLGARTPAGPTAVAPAPAPDQEEPEDATPTPTRAVRQP